MLATVAEMVPSLTVVESLEAYLYLYEESGYDLIR